ncbi:MAG TPA: AMP-binding protein, partial [Solirubrobacteraceae bacterium]
PLAQAIFDDPAQAAPELRILLTGGDRLQRNPPQGTEFAVVNNYGPTEYSVVTSSCTLVAGDPAAPPIGRPIANTQVYVLDRNLNPVPIGVPGELHVGGLGLARGYHGRSELTVQKFITAPWPGGPRLYKTGDQVRWRADGRLEFLGRLDHQVKVRGYRIELGEIEAALTEHEQVREAVAVVQEGAVGSRLVAYVVPRVAPRLNGGSNGSPDQAAHRSLVVTLKSWLRARLPDYMVPADIVVLDRLPQTPNGKIDRIALAVPDAARDELESAYVRPRTPLEEVVTAIWAEILNVERVGIDDNFFDIGGHSLLAARLVARVRERLRFEVPLQTLFRAPTPAQFAASLLQQASNPAAIEKIAELIASLAQLSDAEVHQMLGRSQASAQASADT